MNPFCLHTHLHLNDINQSRLAERAGPVSQRRAPKPRQHPAGHLPQKVGTGSHPKEGQVTYCQLGLWNGVGRSDCQT